MTTDPNTSSANASQDMAPGPSANASGVDEKRPGDQQPAEDASADQELADQERADSEGHARIGLAIAWSAAVLAVLGLVGGAGYLAWRLGRAPAKAPAETRLVGAETRARPPVKPPRVPFRDVTAEAGLDFTHYNGAHGLKLLPETMGGGAAFFDYDQDGDFDLLLTNGAPWPGQPAPNPTPTAALYRNRGDGRFENVTVGSGLDAPLYGMGAAVGDYDNDGWPDVFLSAVGASKLFHNRQGKFVDVTAEAGVAGDAHDWSTACGWFDYNRDGRLDLFVVHYVRWSREIDLNVRFTLDGVNRAYGQPVQFEGAFPRLYRNEGGGRFRDVSAEAGVRIRNPLTNAPLSKSLGLAFCDIDGDGWLDALVANDTVQNLALHNQRDGTFRERGAEWGLAFGPDGAARGAMGIDAACFRDADSLGVVIGNFANEMTSLYVSQGDRSKLLQFSDEAIPSGLGPPTRRELTFGVFFFDADLDGRLDVLSCNGHLDEAIEKLQATQRYAQPPRLLWNTGGAGGAEFVSLGVEEVGEDFLRPLVGRGATFADIDGDGDLDVLLAAVGGPPRLLRNDQPTKHHWLRVKLEGATAPRDAIGAELAARVGGQIQRRSVAPTRGYLSQVEPVVTFGLGTAVSVDQLEIRWPDGTTQVLEDLEVDRQLTVRQAK